MRPTVAHRCDTVAINHRTATVEAPCPIRIYALTVAHRRDPGKSRACAGAYAHAREEILRTMRTVATVRYGNRVFNPGTTVIAIDRAHSNGKCHEFLEENRYFLGDEKGTYHTKKAPFQTDLPSVVRSGFWDAAGRDPLARGRTDAARAYIRTTSPPRCPRWRFWEVGRKPRAEDGPANDDKEVLR